MLEHFADRRLQFLDVGADFGAQHVVCLFERHEPGAEFGQVGGAGVDAAVAGFVVGAPSRRGIQFEDADGERAERAEQYGCDGPVHGRVESSEFRVQRIECRLADLGLRIADASWFAIRNPQIRNPHLVITVPARPG